VFIYSTIFNISSKDKEKKALLQATNKKTHKKDQTLRETNGKKSVLIPNPLTPHQTTVSSKKLAI